MANIIQKYKRKIIDYAAKSSAQYSDIKEKEFWEIYDSCKPYTMTSIERMYALYKAVLYVLSNKIPGDFVECGVWRGGSAMLMASILKNRKVNDRQIYLYDTFEGMSAPTNDDFDVFGKNAANLMENHKDNKEESVWCLASLEDVQKNMSITQFAKGSIRYVKGKVEDTMPKVLPSNIALLRLDTDWYESTKHELEQLYPQLVTDGVLIIDDYGHWEGCRKAVDEYFEKNKVKMLLNRIDYTGRMGIKSS